MSRNINCSFCDSDVSAFGSTEHSMPCKLRLATESCHVWPSDMVCKWEYTRYDPSENLTMTNGVWKVANDSLASAVTTLSAEVVVIRGGAPFSFKFQRTINDQYPLYTNEKLRLDLVFRECNPRVFDLRMTLARYGCDGYYMTATSGDFVYCWHATSTDRVKDAKDKLTLYLCSTGKMSPNCKVLFSERWGGNMLLSNGVTLTTSPPAYPVTTHVTAGRKLNISKTQGKAKRGKARQSKAKTPS